MACATSSNGGALRVSGRSKPYSAGLTNGPRSIIASVGTGLFCNCSSLTSTLSRSRSSGFSLLYRRSICCASDSKISSTFPGGAVFPITPNSREEESPYCTTTYNISTRHPAKITFSMCLSTNPSP